MQKDSVEQVLSRMREAFNVSTNKALASQLGVSPNTIDVWKRRGSVPEKNLLKCMNLTGYPLEWLKSGGKKPDMREGEVVAKVEVPLLYGGAGGGIYNYSAPVISFDPTFFPFIDAKHSIAIQVSGDSMEPTLFDGDFIIVSTLNKGSEDGIYAIRIDGAIKIKSLQFNLDGTIKIISYNPRYEPQLYDPKESQIDFEIIGKKILRITNK